MLGIGKQRNYLGVFPSYMVQPVTVSVSELICLSDTSFKVPLRCRVPAYPESTCCTLPLVQVLGGQVWVSEIRPTCDPFLLHHSSALETWASLRPPQNSHFSSLVKTRQLAYCVEDAIVTSPLNTPLLLSTTPRSILDPGSPAQDSANSCCSRCLSCSLGPVLTATL